MNEATVSVVKDGHITVHGPIHTWVTEHEVGARIALSDFLQQLVEEIGNPTFLVSKAKLQEKINLASNIVIKRMKQATTKVAISPLRKS